MRTSMSVLRDLHLLTDKPVMYVANVDENGFTDNPRLDRVREIAEAEGAVVVPVCAAIEAEISQLDEADRAEFLAELKLDEPGLNRVIRGAYKLLGLADLFHRGRKEVRAWTVRAGSTAPQAAGVIHTDFERGFIRAEVIAYADYIAYQGESGRARSRQTAPGRQGVHRPRGRCHALPVQRLTGILSRHAETHKSSGIICHACPHAHVGGHERCERTLQTTGSRQRRCRRKAL